ncbi:hypothetical protein ACLOJK_002353 [Asimina triloba]
MAVQRGRRHHENRFPLPTTSTIAAAASLALLFIAFLSFLTPTPIDNHSLPPRRRASGEDAGEVAAPAVGDELFRVPSGGGSAGRDLWSSTMAEFYYGCSNASSKLFDSGLGASDSFSSFRRFIEYLVAVMSMMGYLHAVLILESRVFMLRLISSLVVLSQSMGELSLLAITFRSPAEAVTHPNRYLAIATSGGLNQQRTGITDAVVAARILNATLVVPKLDAKSFWKDSSNFAEIFDVDWFISFLSKDVKIIRQLPKKGDRVMGAYNMRVPRKCNPRCYQTRVLPVLQKKRAVQLSKFDYRLSNRLETDLQKLRCRVNYHALKFTEPILEMGRKLVARMREKSSHFIALHLSLLNCDAVLASNPDKERRHGKCPLTPEEVGLMLRAIGFGNDVHIYVASGEVYGGEETLAPLRALFPNFHTKETLSSKEELAPFMTFSSRMAALDFIVCDESDVFVTNNNGNMARMLAGRRCHLMRYFGHKRTIRPNAKKLYSLFLNRPNMTWETFASRVRTNQRGFMGEPKEVRPGRGEFHENPSTCICENLEMKAVGSDFQRNHKDGSKHEKDDPIKSIISEATDDHIVDDEPTWADMDYGENSTILEGKLDEMGLDDNLFNRMDDPELEDLLSD